MIEEVDDNSSGREVNFHMVNIPQLKKIETFKSIEKFSTNLLNDEVFKDDQFKIVNDHQDKRKTKRLAEMYEHNSPLFVDIKTGKNRDKFTKK